MLLCSGFNLFRVHIGDHVEKAHTHKRHGRACMSCSMSHAHSHNHHCLQHKRHMQSWRGLAQQLLSPLSAHLAESLVVQGGQQFWDLAPETLTREPSCNEVLVSGTFTADTNQTCCATASSDGLVMLACLKARPTLCKVQRHLVLLPPCAATGLWSYYVLQRVQNEAVCIVTTSFRVK